MRREITAAVVGGLVLGGVMATPAFAARIGADKVNGSVKAQSAAHAKAMTVIAQLAKVQTSKAKTTAMKTVIYHGYEFRAPANWPVYRLDEHPTTCVRYDINAIYLGTPSADMQCPPNVIGHTSTITVIPGVTIAAGSGSEITYLRDQPEGVGGTLVGSLAAVHAAIIKNASEHELRVAIGAALLGITALGTYGASPALTEGVLDTLRPAPRGAANTPQTAPLPALPASTGARESTGQGEPAVAQSAASSSSAATQPASTRWPGVPPTWPIQIVQQPPRLQPVNGFDACTAPSLAAMSAWRRAYSAVGVYIGGENMGCLYGNLSASWVRSAIGMSWGLLPIYVGKQAPCTKATQVTTISRSQAAVQGSQSGRDAVSDAKAFGLGAGSAIFYDLEAYDTAFDPGCKIVVLTFISAWDRAVAAAGYQTGVYSSKASGVTDLQAATLTKTPGFTAPDAIWDADWDGIPSLTNDGLRAWPVSDRIKQYEGPVWVTIGGFSLQIDKDLVGGPITR